MAVYFSPSVPVLNRAEDYERIEKECPALWADLPEDAKACKNIDELDWSFLTLAHKHFKQIEHSNERLQMFRRVWERLAPVSERAPLREYRGDWIYKQQSLASLALKSICLPTIEPESEELTSFEQVCSRVSLLFRGLSHDLEFLYRRMPSIEYLDELDLFQLAPHPSFPSRGQPKPPIRSRRNLATWDDKDWSRDHCTGWVHALSLLRLILGNRPMTIKPYRGLQEEISVWERICRHDWKYGFSFLQGFGRAVEVNLKNLCNSKMGPEERTVNFSPLEFFSDSRQADSPPLIDAGRPEVIVHLIRMGMNPLAKFDFSEIATGRPTEWKAGASSPYYLSYLELAFECSTQEIVKAFLEVGDPIGEYYRTSGLKDTLYQRATMNYEHPSVLIPLLEAAAKHPNEPLALEINSFSKEGEQKKCLIKPFARVAADEVWRRRPCNYLLLSCVGGDLAFAKYLVEKVEAEARAACGETATEEEKEIAAALAASAFVNRSGDNFSPDGTPVEIASRSAQAEMVAYLCEKGAQASIEIRMQAAQRLNTRVIDVFSQWEEVEKQILSEIQQIGLQINRKQLDELISVTIAWSNNMIAIKATQQSSLDILKSNHEMLDQILEIIEMEKNGQLVMQENPKPVIEYYRKKHGLVLVPNSIASLPVLQTTGAA